jgi:hypothetical protein
MGEKPIFHGELGHLDVQRDPFAYSKDFDPNNPKHFEAWLKMCPSHMTDAEWQFRLGELKLMLEGVQHEETRSKLMSRWKSECKLLPEQK